MVTQILFESPGWAIVVFAIAWALLRVTGRRTDNKRLMHLSWLSLAFVGALVATSSLVTTKREELPKALDAMLLAVEHKDTAKFRQLVLPDAMTGVFNRELTRDQVEAMIDSAKINDLKATSSSVVFEDADNAQTLILIRADGSVSDMPGVEISEWAIRWRYTDGQWRAQRLQCIAIGADAIFNRD